MTRVYGHARSAGKRVLGIAASAIVLVLATAHIANAATAWTDATATWYGPGFYGHPFACSARADVPDHYTQNVRGAASMTLPCGTRVTICRRHRCVRVQIIDRGAFAPGNFDLTARTAQDLCRCWAPYTMQVRWHR